MRKKNNIKKGIGKQKKEEGIKREGIKGEIGRRIKGRREGEIMRKGMNEGIRRKGRMR